MTPADGMRRALRHFWHPVCTLAEAETAAALGRPLGVRLLGDDLAVALLDGRPVAFPDRCLHRSTRLSLGSLDGATLRCAGHGWQWAADGHCAAIPDVAPRAIPARARLDRLALEVAHGLVWARLEGGLTWPVPPCRLPALGLAHEAGAPYVWSIAAARRVEFGAEPARWLHLLPAEHRALALDPAAFELHSRPGLLELQRDGDPRRGVVGVECRVTLPFTVEVVFVLPDGGRIAWWMTASPLDDVAARCFWMVGASPAGPGLPVPLHPARLADAHRAAVRAEEPVLTSATPAALPLAPGSELSTRHDAVSVAYRRALVELVNAGVRGPGPLAGVLGLLRVAGE